ncbi:hypothetical protein D4764_03G0011710 [Takifugu flavidus]|uniref:Uncharacterized protein n=1 Tax=Takifugu flavidus TaxID=433684 RepID=A0A5C6NAM8_9TELE|nr:hypothetical protein D4764_03G0011710 [Takifugu flavidus]
MCLCCTVPGGKQGTVHWGNQTTSPQKNGTTQTRHLFRSGLSSPLTPKGEWALLRGQPILAREDRWVERGVKEAIHVKLEKPSLNRGGGLRHFLSPTSNAVLHCFQQQTKHSHHSRRPGDSPPCDPADKGETPQQKLGERLCQRLSARSPASSELKKPSG